jgi:hypothetical protein
MSKKKVNKKKHIQGKDLVEISGSLINETPHNFIESTIENYEISLESQKDKHTYDQMSIVQKRRFIDDMEMIKKSEDFVLRKHFGSSFPLFIAYSFIFILCMLFLLTYSDSLGLTVMVTMLIAVGVLVNYYYLKKYHRINNAIEFQNYIFANALRSENDFYFIFNDDGNTVYSDSRMKKIMDSDASKDLHELDFLILTFKMNSEMANTLKNLVFEHNKQDNKADNSAILSYKISHPKFGKYAIIARRLNKPMDYTILKLVKFD